MDEQLLAKYRLPGVLYFVRFCRPISSVDAPVPLLRVDYDMADKNQSKTANRGNFEWAARRSRRLLYHYVSYTNNPVRGIIFIMNDDVCLVIS